MDISEIIKDLVDKHINKWRVVKSAYEINDGYCMDFAEILLKDKNLPKGKYFQVDSFTFAKDITENYLGTITRMTHDWKYLKNQWGITPPNGMTEEDMDDILFGHHVWITDGKKHYDAEAPEGVDNFFDLPIFKHDINLALEKKAKLSSSKTGQEINFSPGQ